MEGSCAEVLLRRPYLGSADYAKFLVQRMEEYKEFYNEVGLTKAIQ